MIRWSITFLMIANLSAIFGFGGIAEGAAYFAQALFFIAIAIFLITLFVGPGRAKA